MNTITTIPTETVKGCVIRQLLQGEPHWVFVEHPGKASRCVCEVAEGSYKQIGQRMQYQGDGVEDSMQIAADYLDATFTR